MKRILAITIAAAAMTSGVLAADNANVVVNEKPIEKSGIIVEGRTLVPVRGVFEELGYSVSWDGEAKTATLTKGSVSVKMTNGESTFTVNEKTIEPDVPQQIIDGSFMLPLRAVSEAIGAKVDWDAESKTAYISMGLKISGTQQLEEDTADGSSESSEAKDSTEKKFDIKDAFSIEVITPDDPIFDKIQGSNDINLD